MSVDLPTPLATAHRDQPPPPPLAGERDAHLVDAGQRRECGGDRRLELGAGLIGQVARLGDDHRACADNTRGAQAMVDFRRQRGTDRRLFGVRVAGRFGRVTHFGTPLTPNSRSEPLFFARRRAYKRLMQRVDGWKEHLGAGLKGLVMAGKNNPWGGGGGEEPGESGPSGEGGGPRNPWLPGGGEPGKRRSASIEDIFKNRGPEGPRRSGGGGPGGPTLRLPERPGGKSWVPVILGGVALIWVGVTSIHFVQPGEQAVVTWFGGKYSHELNPGTNFTAPGRSTWSRRKT